MYTGNIESNYLVETGKSDNVMNLSAFWFFSYSKEDTKQKSLLQAIMKVSTKLSEKTSKCHIQSTIVYQKMNLIFSHEQARYKKLPKMIFHASAKH